MHRRLVFTICPRAMRVWHDNDWDLAWSWRGSLSRYWILRICSSDASGLVNAGTIILRRHEIDRGSARRYKRKVKDCTCLMIKGKHYCLLETPRIPSTMQGWAVLETPGSSHSRRRPNVDFLGWTKTNQCCQTVWLGRRAIPVPSFV